MDFVRFGVGGVADLWKRRRLDWLRRTGRSALLYTRAKCVNHQHFYFLSFFLSSLQRGGKKNVPPNVLAPDLLFQKNKWKKKETRKILIVNKQNILPCPGTLASLTPSGKLGGIIHVLPIITSPVPHLCSREGQRRVDDDSPRVDRRRVHFESMAQSIRLCASNSTLAKAFFFLAQI